MISDKQRSDVTAELSDKEVFCPIDYIGACVNRIEVVIDE